LKKNQNTNHAPRREGEKDKLPVCKKRGSLVFQKVRPKQREKEMLGEKGGNLLERLKHDYPTKKHHP